MKLFLLKKSFYSAIIASLLLITSCATQPQGDFVPYYQAETQIPYDDVFKVHFLGEFI
jgi:PBP1b-binding outer membrane lipoprotein LpoB